MQHHQVINWLLLVIGILTVILLIKELLKLDTVARKNCSLLFIMILITLFFFACELQTNGSFIEFIKHFVDKNVYGWSIPSSSFSAAEPGFVILVSPVVIFILKFFKLEFSTIQKQAIGLFFQALCFGVFTMVAWWLYRDSGMASVSIIMLAMLLLAIGEVLVMPPLISSITQLAPTHLKGTIMGTLYLSLAYSGYLAGGIAKFTSTNGNSNNIIGYFITYRNITILTLAVFFIILITYLIFNRVRSRMH